MRTKYEVQLNEGQKEKYKQTTASDRGPTRLIGWNHEINECQPSGNNGKASFAGKKKKKKKKRKTNTKLVRSSSFAKQGPFGSVLGCIRQQAIFWQFASRQ